MYNLLEKPDQIILHLFQYLVNKNSCCLEDAAKALQLKVKSLRRYIRLWQQNGSQFASGVSFFVKKDHIILIASSESKRLFKNFLLSRSQSFQLLLQITDDPYCKLKNLATSQYLSTTTIQRRFQSMQPFLARYQLSVSFSTHPILKGSELQIRYFTYLISLLRDPLLAENEGAFFKRYQKIQERRINAGFSLDRSFLLPTASYYPIPFLINDRSLLFLWKQYLGLETLWIEPSLCETLEFSLLAHTHVSQWSVLMLAQKLHRLHSFCDLFKGNLLPLSNIALSQETQGTIQSFKRLIPHYQTLLAWHPELPLAYEKLLQNELSATQNGHIVAEE